jgi:hypothetical protein
MNKKKFNNIEKKLTQQALRFELEEQHCVLSLANKFRVVAERKKRECLFGYNTEIKADQEESGTNKLEIIVTKTVGKTLNDRITFSNQAYILNQTLIPFLRENLINEKKKGFRRLWSSNEQATSHNRVN